jgi:uncharacterized protein YecE (DUF72 family)
MAADEFCSRLDHFFLKLPRDFRYAVEVRNPGLLGMPYCLMLSRHGVAHVYNHWSGMPTLAEQHTRMQGFTAAFTVLRLLTPLGMSYAAAKKRAEPYTKIVEELPQMRQDTMQVVRQAVGAGRRAYVLVNNRAEGNAPSTVEALVGMLRG